MPTVATAALPGVCLLCTTVESFLLSLLSQTQCHIVVWSEWSPSILWQLGLGVEYMMKLSQNTWQQLEQISLQPAFGASQDQGVWGWFRDYSNTLHLLCTLFLLLLYQLYLRSLDIRSQRLGIPSLGKHYINVRYYQEPCWFPERLIKGTLLG